MPRPPFQSLSFPSSRLQGALPYDNPAFLMRSGTRGFAAPEDASTAVCVLPGTELAFANAVRYSPRGLFAWKPVTVAYTTAIFRQVNKHNPRTHHDALEFPDGQTVLLTDVFENQEATVLQLPAQPTTAAEVQAQKRDAHVG